MLWAGGALDGADFPVGPALAPPPAGALVPAELPPAVGSEFRSHSRGVSPPATARITRTPASTSQRCRRRSAARSGPAYGGPGGGPYCCPPGGGPYCCAPGGGPYCCAPGGPGGGEGGSRSAELGEPSAESSPTASGGPTSAGYGVRGAGAAAGRLGGEGGADVGTGPVGAPASAAFAAVASSDGVANRSSGRFAMPRAITASSSAGTPWTSSLGRGGSRCRCA